MSQISKTIYHLNEKQKAMIKRGKQQIANGEYISNDDLEKEEDQWLMTNDRPSTLFNGCFHSSLFR